MELTLSTPAPALRAETDLVAAARRGDARAFEQLYATYRDRVTAFITSKVRDYGRAEDIAQEVFISALRQLRNSEQEIVFKPWIFAIAKNACIDEFRRASRGREITVDGDEGFAGDDRVQVNAAPSPPSAVESKQQLEDLRGAFTGLSENHHRLLVMREFEGRSYEEIGTTLGMTRQMVESGLFRARRKLTEEYEDLATGRRCEQIQMVIDSGAAARLKALGIKERRRLSQHLSHCQGCRHHALMAGVDQTLLKPRSLAAKVAALLPFGGLWRWPWRRGGSAGHAATTHLASSGAAGAVQAAGAGSSLLAQAAAGVAALAIAGVGGGVAIADHHHHALPRPTGVHIRDASQRAAGAAPAVSSGARSGGGVAARRSSAGNPGARGHVAVTPARARSGAASSIGSGVAALKVNKRAQPLKHRPRRSAGDPSGGSGSGSASGSGSGSASGSGAGSGSGSGSGSGGPGGSGSTTNSGSPSVGGTAKSVVNNTLNGVGGTVDKVTAPVLNSPPVKDVTGPLNNVTGTVLNSPPVKKITTPVTKAVDPVLNSPPVKSVGSTINGLLGQSGAGTGTSTGSGSTSTSGGSTSDSGGSSGSSDTGTPGGAGPSGPVGTVKKILGGL